MKKLIIFIFCLALLMSMSGCRDDLQGDNKISEHLADVDLGEYVESIKLPPNLSITFEPSEIEERETAKIYNVTWLKLDPEEVAGRLLRFDILSTKNYAEGPWFESGDGKWAEYLSIHDGVLESGMSYSLVDKNAAEALAFKLFCVIDPSPGFPDNVAQISGYTRKLDYDTKRDLDFLGYEEAVSETEKVLVECGFPDLALQEVYSLDLETMDEHYQLYLDAVEPSEQVEWSLEDECYLIYFRQVLDGIPLINITWEGEMRKDWSPTETPIYAIYSKDGVISIDARGLFEVCEEENEGALISASAALQYLLDDYEKSTQISETKIVSMELNYVGTYSEEKIQMVPAWVFGISHSEKIEDSDEIVDVYTSFIINALTGERIRTAVDNR